VSGELEIRKLFGMLNSAMFVVTEEEGADGGPAGWTFRGGGWGHGVGMCQMGAIGRALAGQDYLEILAFYFNGAQTAQLY
jgi:SpoIID/LytB domain protein